MRTTKVIITASLIVLFTATVAAAIPSLQLDILNGTYNDHSETIVATSDPFTLYAYLIPDSKTPLTDTYYISAAAVPKVGQNGADLGSFTFDGVTSSVTASMVYGNPPVETYETQLKDHGDLASHGIFPTYFIQFAFQFDSNNLADAYNTADDPGSGPTPYSSGKKMYYESFSVDTSNLADNYFIHFDLYNTKDIQETQKICGEDIKRCKGEGKHKDCVYIVLGYDVDIKDFAPFSHDAQSGDGCDHHKVPEPETLLLLGCGLVGLVFFARRRVKK